MNNLQIINYYNNAISLDFNSNMLKYQNEKFSLMSYQLSDFVKDESYLKDINAELFFKIIKTLVYYSAICGLRMSELLKNEEFITEIVPLHYIITKKTEYQRLMPEDIIKKYAVVANLITNQKIVNNQLASHHEEYVNAVEDSEKIDNNGGNGNGKVIAKTMNGNTKGERNNEFGFAAVIVLLIIVANIGVMIGAAIIGH